MLLGDGWGKWLAGLCSMAVWTAYNTTQRQLGSSRTPARDLRHSKERAQEVRMSSENGAYHRRLGPVQGVWWMECIGARQTCKKNGLERRQERLERTCGRFLGWFPKKGKKGGWERKKWRETLAKQQQITQSLCVNLFDIISYHIIS